MIPTVPGGPATAEGRRAVAHPAKLRLLVLLLLRWWWLLLLSRSSVGTMGTPFIPLLLMLVGLRRAVIQMNIGGMCRP